MKMKPEDFRRALEIITSNNQITVSFNTPVKDNYSNTHPILIHESNAAVLKQLQQEEKESKRNRRDAYEGLRAQFML